MAENFHQWLYLKEKFPPGIFVQAIEKGWINKEYFAIWLKEIWGKRRDAFIKPKSILITDSVHLI